METQAPSKRGTFFQFDFAELRLGRTDEPPSPGATHPEENIKYKTYDGAVELYFTAGPSTESTEGNKIHPYRSKKMAHKVKSKHFIESNTFLKSKRKVGSFKDSTAASEGTDQLEKR
ncbi:uncharacterized protein LOC134824268 [Bolinopsis microptera]|uniref:uncharacterized protein LOC134824268 n=1 Tax=Bolinopsis microptera TaxID=2820187 RepID=UPI00307A0339